MEKNPQLIPDTGFTLLEMIIALAIGAILVTIGVPTLNQFLNSQRTNAQINDLITTVREAQTTALTLSSSTLIVPTGGNYANGWQMGLDTDNDGITIETVMRVATDASQLTFVINPGTLTFDIRGRTQPTLFSINPVNCSDAQNPRRDINVALAGHIDITTCACAAGSPCP